MTLRKFGGKFYTSDESMHGCEQNVASRMHVLCIGISHAPSSIPLHSLMHYDVSCRSERSDEEDIDLALESGVTSGTFHHPIWYANYEAGNNCRRSSRRSTFASIVSTCDSVL